MDVLYTKRNKHINSSTNLTQQLYLGIQRKIFLWVVIATLLLVLKSTLIAAQLIIKK